MKFRFPRDLAFALATYGTTARRQRGAWRSVDDRMDVVDSARVQMLAAADSLASAYDWRESKPDDRHGADAIDLSHDELALAARDLVAATDALPADLQPVGWRKGAAA